MAELDENRVELSPLKILTLEMGYRGMANVSITGPQEISDQKSLGKDKLKNKDLIDSKTKEFVEAFRFKLETQRDRFPNSLVNSEVELCIASAAKEHGFEQDKNEILYIINPHNPIQAISYKSTEKLKCPILKDEMPLLAVQFTILDSTQFYTFTPYIDLTMVLEIERGQKG